MAESIFTTQTPAGQFNDGNGIALGTVFRSDVDGRVTGSRFYRATAAPGAAGTFKGGLYTITSEGAGAELARVTFGATVAGWNTALFAAPVNILAGSLYLAVYWSPGDYVATSDAFAAAVTNGHLTATQAGNPFGNGRFSFPAADLAFLASSGNGANYFADVLFELASAGMSSSVTETITIADTVTRTVAVTRAVGDALTLADAAAVGASSAVSLADAVHLADSVSAGFAPASPARAAPHYISATKAPASVSQTVPASIVRRSV